MINAKPDSFETIAKDILTNVGKLLATRPYIAITDMSGSVLFIDAPLEIYAKFIQNFVANNFHLLQLGDHSLPLGGVNLAFFKVSDKAIIVLYTVKGITGQLLAFKGKMFEWTTRIDQLMGGPATPLLPQQPPFQVTSSVAVPQVIASVANATTVESTTLSSAGPATATTKAGLKTVPFLMKKLTGKEKFPLEDAQILQFCDGTNSIEDICAKTGYARLKVDQVIREYQKRKWIELKRIVL